MRRTKRAVVWPKVSSSPPSIISRSMGAPSRRVPLVEPRSSTTKPLSAREILRVPPRDVRVVDDDVVLLRAARRSTGPRPSSGCVSSSRTSSTISRASPWRLASSAEMAAVPCSASAAGRSSVRKMRVWPEVSCGAPFSRGPVAAGQLRGHAELPEAERLLRLEADPRRGHQVVVLVLGVGGGVLDQLVPQGRLVGLDGLRVLPGEVDREVVGGVGAGDRDHPALVHLLGEALGDLDGVDLPPEGPSEDALDEGLHPLFDVFEETQRNLPSNPRREVPEHPVYYSREAERNHSLERASWGSFRRRLARTPGAATDHRDGEPHDPACPTHSAERDDPGHRRPEQDQERQLGKVLQVPLGPIEQPLDPKRDRQDVELRPEKGSSA